MDERCFRPLLCTVKAELGRGQPGLMRWIWDETLPQSSIDRSIFYSAAHRATKWASGRPRDAIRTHTFPLTWDGACVKSPKSVHAFSVGFICIHMIYMYSLLDYCICMIWIVFICAAVNFCWNSVCVLLVLKKEKITNKLNQKEVMINLFLVVMLKISIILWYSTFPQTDAGCFSENDA